MYLLPLLFSNLHLGLDAPFNSMDFSTGTLSKTNLALDFFYKPWINLLNHNQYIASTTNIDDDVFKITMNVQQFNPEEITVKVIDGWVVVEAKHKKHNKINIATRQFVKQYLLPNRVDVNQVTSSISKNGILTITAPLKLAEEKMIQIEVDARQTATGQTTAGQAGTGHAEKTNIKQAGGRTNSKADAGQVTAEKIVAEKASAEYTKAQKTNAGKASAYYTQCDY
ncbi:alpha-crystallin A chain isoform X1 [Monomorium pharaonis]|uniref:alpha-crystallin A chain isoform X1 n=1 Tax=Monomorium pharaonis TaxID=307658 RepID=UPI00102E109B|nr:alpha-crystallin A chain isoform X1 [Monomorium pharaonis]